MSSVDNFDVDDMENHQEDNSMIIYTTIAIIIGLIFIWLLIVFLTGEDPIKILHEMTNLSSQVTPENDNIAL